MSLLMFISGLGLLQQSCSKEATTLTTTDIITPGKNLDIGNDQSSGDIFAVFGLNTVVGVEKIEVMLIASGSFTSVSNIDVSDVPANARQEIPVSGLIYKLRLRGGLSDIGGSDISDGVYKLVYLVTQDGETLINQAVGSITLSEKHVLEGRFVGTWNDNIYSDFGISATITVANGRLDGIFYYSPNFTPCCGGSDDGTIRMKISEAGQISDFTYSQTLDSFMGGACPGLYEGAGMVQDIISLFVNFSGNDCEGDHTGGKILLTRVE